MVDISTVGLVPVPTKGQRWEGLAESFLTTYRSVSAPSSELPTSSFHAYAIFCTRGWRKRQREQDLLSPFGDTSVHTYSRKGCTRERPTAYFHSSSARTHTSCTRCHSPVSLSYILTIHRREKKKNCQNCQRKVARRTKARGDRPSLRPFFPSHINTFSSTSRTRSGRSCRFAWVITALSCRANFY